MTSAVALLTLRHATPDDARAIHGLIARHLDEGRLLPRDLGEITIHAHRFVVASDDDGVVGCADLAPLSRTVAEVRSLVVSDRARSTGVGSRLIDALVALPETAKIGDRVVPFRNCVEGLNDMAEDIETVERECFCDAIYRIGTIVGLEARSQFVERWRGDW